MNPPSEVISELSALCNMYDVACRIIRRREHGDDKWLLYLRGEDTPSPGSKDGVYVEVEGYDFEAWRAAINKLKFSNV